MSIEAMKQALYLIRNQGDVGVDEWIAAEAALCTAIEQAEKNDLERLRDENERLHIENRRLIDRIEVMGVPVGVGGYLTTTTTPQPQREWVGLTDEEINDLVHSHDDFDGLWEFADAVEAKLKEKNT